MPVLRRRSLDCAPSKALTGAGNQVGSFGRSDDLGAWFKDTRCWAEIEAPDGTIDNSMPKRGLLTEFAEVYDLEWGVEV
jgi:hypothetical protein